MKLLSVLLVIAFGSAASAAVTIPNCFDREEGKPKGLYYIALEGANQLTLGHFMKFSSPTEAASGLRPAQALLLTGRFYLFVLESTDLKSEKAKDEAEKQLEILLMGLNLTPNEKAKADIRCVDNEKTLSRLQFDAPAEVKDDGPSISIKTHKVEVPKCPNGKYRVWKSYNALIQGEPAWRQILKIVSYNPYMKTLTFPIEDESLPGYYRFEVSVSPENEKEGQRTLQNLAEVPAFITCVDKSEPVPR